MASHRQFPSGGREFHNLILAHRLGFLDHEYHCIENIILNILTFLNIFQMYMASESVNKQQTLAGKVLPLGKAGLLRLTVLHNILAERHWFTCRIAVTDFLGMAWWWFPSLQLLSKPSGVFNSQTTAGTRFLKEESSNEGEKPHLNPNLQATAVEMRKNIFMFYSLFKRHVQVMPSFSHTCLVCFTSLHQDAWNS